MRDRRTKEGYKLRVYMDAIKEAKAMTDQEWSDNWTLDSINAPYVSRTSWVSYLEQCALKEAEKFMKRAA